MDKPVFLFPGQGSQYVGMGQTLCRHSSTAADVFRQADNILNTNLSQVCFQGPFSELSRPESLQPAILTATVAAYSVFQEEFGLIPDYLVGHSFGELSALVCAQAIEFKQGLLLARMKGEIIAGQARDLAVVMTAVRYVDRSRVESVCDRVSVERDDIVLGIINSRQEFVLSGRKEIIRKAEKELEAAGAGIERLPMKVPFHSPLIKPAADRISEQLNDFEFIQPKTPVISSLDRQVLTTAPEIKKSLSRQLTRQLDWVSMVKYLDHLEVDTAVEIGPKKTLSSLMQDIETEIDIHSFSSPRDLERLKQKLGTTDNAGLTLLETCLRLLVSTQNNNPDAQEYEQEINLPFKRLQDTYFTFKDNQYLPDKEEAKRFLEQAFGILRKKHLNDKEIEEVKAEITQACPTLLKDPELRKVLDSS